MRGTTGFSHGKEFIPPTGQTRLQTSRERKSWKGNHGILFHVPWTATSRDCQKIKNSLTEKVTPQFTLLPNTKKFPDNTLQERKELTRSSIPTPWFQLWTQAKGKFQGLVSCLLTHIHIIIKSLKFRKYLFGLSQPLAIHVYRKSPLESFADW